jgi:hypothetical protein
MPLSRHFYRLTVGIVFIVMSALPDHDLAARAEALRERAEGEFPESWRPGEEDQPETLVGLLESKVVGPDLGYGPREIVVLRTLEGVRWSVWLIHDVLIQEFERQKPNPGDLIAVHYDGRREGGQGKSGFHMYRLVVDHAIAAVSDSAPSAEPLCPECQRVESDHAPGCPNEIPF